MPKVARKQSEQLNLNQLRGRLMYVVAILDASGASEVAAEEHALQAAKDPKAALDSVILQLEQLRESCAVAAFREILRDLSEVLG